MRNAGTNAGKVNSDQIHLEEDVMFLLIASIAVGEKKTQFNPCERRKTPSYT